MTRPLPTVGRSIGRGGLKAEPPIPPPDGGVEGHVPGEADDDHGHQHRAGDGEVPSAVRRLAGRRESGGSAGR